MNEQSANTNMEDDLREHYDFDYQKARPNRFAERLKAPNQVVVLEPDIAAVFKTSAAVNDALRVLIAVAGNVAELPQLLERVKGATPSEPTPQS